MTQVLLLLFAAAFTYVVSRGAGKMLIDLLWLKLYRSEEFFFGFVLGSAMLSTLVFALTAARLAYTGVFLAASKLLRLLGDAELSCCAQRPLEDLREKAAVYWRFYGGPLLSIPLLVLPFAFRRDRRIRLTFLMAAGFSLALVFQVWHNPHYGAPATGLVILVVVLCTRRLRLWRWKKRAIGLCLVRCLPVAAVLMLAIQIFSLRLTDLGPRPARWPDPGGVARAKILAQLAHSGEKHLVFVRYKDSHDTGDEWVYNDADIDGSPGGLGNAKLIEYFKGRRSG